MPITRSNVLDLKGKLYETREQVLERLFRDHHGDLRAFLIGRTGLESEVEDVIQGVFARLAKMDDLQEKLPRGRKSNIPYLFSMAHNLVVDMERHKAMRRTHMSSYQNELILDLPEPPTPEAIAQTAQELQRVKTVILNLRPKWRRAFILNRFKFMTYRQIAEDMGVSVKQVEKYMKNALLKLREERCVVVKEEPER